MIIHFRIDSKEVFLHDNCDSAGLRYILAQLVQTTERQPNERHRHTSGTASHLHHMAIGSMYVSSPRIWLCPSPDKKRDGSPCWPRVVKVFV